MRRNTKRVTLVALFLAFMMCMAVGCGEASGKSEYNVYMSTDVSYTISGESTAKAGEDYSFTVTPKDGYDASAMKVVVNGQVLTAVDGKYTVSAVDDVIAIYVSGIQEPPAPVIEYVNVAFSGEHVDFTGDSTVVKGSEYTFTAVAYDGYALGEVKSGETVLTATEGVYKVTADDNLTISATATEIVKYDIAVVEGDTKSEGGKVYIGEDGRTHLSVEYKPIDRFMKNDGTEACHYSEVGFKLTEDAWANAPVGANMAIVTLRIDWGEDIGADIQASEGSSLWMVEDGMQDFGGNMQWPGLYPGMLKNGNTAAIRLSKADKICVRNVDGFDATVLSIEFKTMENVLIANELLEEGKKYGTYNVAMDENKDVYFTAANGYFPLNLDLTKIFGDAVKGKKVHLDVMLLDDVYGTGAPVVGGGAMPGRTNSFDLTADANGYLQLENGFVPGLAKIHFTLVAE